MRIPFVIFLVLSFVVIGCSHSNSGPLSFQSPADWKVEHKTAGGIDFYTITAKTPDEGLLMFSRWPPPGKPQDIPALVQELADRFLEQAKKSSEFALTSEKYHVEQFVGEGCRGSYATFEIANNGTNLLQTMFMMSVDGKVWNGQFTGTQNGWEQALTVLKSIKNDG